ncbi:MAG TPA: CFI-box-CTERM domain-containing protein [Humisphaera sp.]|jgi:hypothetical protein|nr:CFI-box-CTERM domain-containing protein [Humisphaera sp.]
MSSAAAAAGQVDLTVAFKALPALQDLNSGKPVVVIVSNQGTAPARGQLTLTFGGQLVSSSQPIAPVASVTKNVNLKPGRSKTIAVAERGWRSPESFFPTVTVDPQNTIGESNLGNNTAISPNALPASQIDLAVAFKKLPTTDGNNNLRPMIVTVTNLGTTTAEGPLTLVVGGNLVSDSSVIHPFQDVTTHVRIAPAKSQTIRIPLQYIRNAYVEVYPTVAIDPQDTFDDTNVANNTIVSPSQVSLYGLPIELGDFKGCFLTTACTEARGLSDDCDELKTLRAVRDSYLMQSQYGRALVAEYYRFAPRLCALISLHPDAMRTYDEMYRGLVLPSVRRAHAGNLLAACNHYERFTLELCRQFNVRVGGRAVSGYRS